MGEREHSWYPEGVVTVEMFGDRSINHSFERNAQRRARNVLLPPFHNYDMSVTILRVTQQIARLKKVWRVTQHAQPSGPFANANAIDNKGDAIQYFANYLVSRARD